MTFQNITNPIVIPDSCIKTYTLIVQAKKTEKTAPDTGFINGNISHV